MQFLERVGFRMGLFGGKAQEALALTPDLATLRLRLGALNEADLDFVEDLVQLPAARRHLGGAVDPGRAAGIARGYLDAAPKETVWAVRHKSSPLAIGLVFLSNPQKARETELSYMFHPDVWGEGFASEAVQKVVFHALFTLRRPRIFAMTQATNGASCRLLERVGMTETGREMRHGEEQVIFEIRPAEAQGRA